MPGVQLSSSPADKYLLSHQRFSGSWGEKFRISQKTWRSRGEDRGVWTSRLPHPALLVPATFCSGSCCVLFLLRNIVPRSRNFCHFCRLPTPLRYPASLPSSSASRPLFSRPHYSRVPTSLPPLRSKTLVRRPHLSNWSLMYFPNRLLFLLRTVWAFPNASRIGLESRILCSILLTLAASSVLQIRNN